MDDTLENILSAPNKLLINRPPRIQPELPVQEIDIPEPPERQEQGWMQLVQVALPFITILGFLFVSSGGGSRLALMIPMLLMVIGSVGFSIYTFLRDRKRQKEQEQEYRERLAELTQDMRHYHDLQRYFYRYNYPDPYELQRILIASIDIAQNRPKKLRSESRLWQRSPDDVDFGVIRIGEGTLPSTVIFKRQQSGRSNSELSRAAEKLANDSKFVSDIPVILKLINQRKSLTDDVAEYDDAEKTIANAPTAHAIGIAGADSATVYRYIRTVLSDYAAFHDPDDAKLYLIAHTEENWSWLQDLSHCQADEQSTHLYFTSKLEEPTEKAPPRFDEDEADGLDNFTEQIRRILSQRKIRAQSQEQEQGQNDLNDSTLPFLLVVVDLLDAGEAEDDTSLSRLRADAAISILLEEGDKLGAAIIYLVRSRRQIPDGCQAIIEVEETSILANIEGAQDNKKVVYRYAATGINAPKSVGRAEQLQLSEINELVNRLNTIELYEKYGAGLTKSVPFLSFMGYDDLSELIAETKEKWFYSVQHEHAGWLGAKFAVVLGNKPRRLRFSADQDGVHGMIAGSTGSGKSEMLISMLLSMAVTYSPETLNFVLVDYKGGTAFNEFKKLPHCVDVITNLGIEGVQRMFTAIDAELKRRQALNVATNTANIVEYRKAGKHLNGGQPYPYLFIIIDEFSEMISANPDFRFQLESITRTGRAQGVSLLLAAQRPTGITDQMRSNIKFRICLRVETTGESREMLRRDAAAFLPPDIPGRGYLQVGNDELEMVQVAYAGEKYAVEAINDEQSENSNTEPEEQLYVELPLYQALIDQLYAAAQEEKVATQYAPWPDFLPTKLHLDNILLSSEEINSAEVVNHHQKEEPITAKRYLLNGKFLTHGQELTGTIHLNPAFEDWMQGDENHPAGGWIENPDWRNYAMQAPIGLIDDPQIGKQYPLVWHVRSGHAVIFSAPGWGKTTFMRTLAVSLAALYSPRHLHMYLLDLGGRNLGVLHRLPQVGAVISPYDDGYSEQVQQLLRDVIEEADKRKLLLEKSGESTVYTYNANNQDEPLPIIVILIDNFTEFKEAFGEPRDNVDSLLDKLTRFMRQSRDYGIHFAFTASQPGEFSSQLYNQCTERFVLKMTDPATYREIVGNVAVTIGDVPGRGYIQQNNRGLTMQIAELTKRYGDDASEYVHQAVIALADRMHRYLEINPMTYPALFPIGALHERVSFHEIIEHQGNIKFTQDWPKELTDLQKRLWSENLTTNEPRWLQTSLGVTPGNRPCVLNLSAAEDGVHGLIAGGTGSGKSELLITLIANLAVNYDPAMLNFVLVDFKGGGTFKPFETLPHVVQNVTNLNKSAVYRMFTSIRAEMERRQRLNVEKDVSDIVDYRKKKFHLNGGDSYPHLMIIIDEYAEMITENPDFQSELDSITRLGRALGVHLILASQRPIGVTDQMRDNIKLRICLRVQEIETSREMLRRSDAAFLPGFPGRGYLQIGNEDIELIQTAYLGESVPVENPNGKEEGSLFDAILRVSQTLIGDRRPQSPWPPALPDLLPMNHRFNPRYLGLDLSKGTRDGNRALLQPMVMDWLNGDGKWDSPNWSGSIMKIAVGALDEPHRAKQGPLHVDLKSGNVVLFGGAGWGKTSFLRSLLISAMAAYSPADLQIYIIDLGRRELAELSDLPHVGSVIMPDEEGFEERVQQLMRDITAMVNIRKPLFTDLYGHNASAQRTDQKTYPAVLVVIDNFDEFIEAFEEYSRAEDNLSVLDTFIALVRQSRAYGFHFVVTASRPNTFSSKLYSLFPERLSLRLANADDYSTIFGNVPGEIDPVPGRGYVKRGQNVLQFQTVLMPAEASANADLEAATQEREQFYTAIQEQALNIEYDEPFSIEPLATSLSYRHLLTQVNRFNLQESFVQQLKEFMDHQWEQTASQEMADWLQVLIGTASGNRPRTLVWEAQLDGVHGMIAGGTGSGKSEVLKTLISGLALNYSPEILNFVLVDYKGGGAFSAFERLPHCVDMLTNLDKSSVDRMFTAITSEIERRQQLGEIIEYRKNGKHITGESYPHLFVIIDEYAEMIDDSEEYQERLDSITRTGRAQGVHLLLAAQKPKGVTSQMRANIRMRLCLKVEERDTSVEMLSRPDAAQLPSIPGRGYLQIGNQGVELVQAAWSGEELVDDRQNLDEGLEDETDEATANHSSSEATRFYDIAVKLSNELVDEHQIQIRKPWPELLPNQYNLTSRLFDSQKNEPFSLSPELDQWGENNGTELWTGVNWQKEAMRIPIGLQDDPRNARQEPLKLDLRDGHTVLFGESGSGKTTLLQTLLISMAATHAPTEAHIHIIDMGGRGFNALNELPHIGALLNSEDETFIERQRPLFQLLLQTINERLQLFSEEGVDDLYAFNADPANKERIQPAILLIIDNFIEFYENNQDLVDTYLIPLLRRSPSRVGITVICTLSTPSGIPMSLMNDLRQKLTLTQSNPDTYFDILGHKVPELSKIPGRGYIRLGGARSLLMQVALPVDEGQSGPEPISLLVERMKQLVLATPENWQPLPNSLAPLPTVTALALLLKKASVNPSEQALQAILGEVQSGQPGTLELTSIAPNFRIAGPPRSGKTTALYNLVLSLAIQYSPEEVIFVLVDLLGRFVEYGGEQSLAELPHALASISTLKELESLLPQVQRLFADRKEGPAVLFVIDDYNDFSDELGSNYNLSEELADLVRFHGQDGLHFAIAGTLDGTSDKLYSRIRRTCHSLALRTAEALERLELSSRSNQLIQKDLAVGRGYLATSDTLTLIQIAIPNQQSHVSTEVDPHGTQEALYDIDSWLEEIHHTWPEPHGIELSVGEPGQDLGRIEDEDSGGSTAIALEESYTDFDLSELDYSGEEELPDESDLLYTPDEDDYEPQWNEPGGQQQIEEVQEEFSQHAIAQQQIQFILASLMMEEDSSKEYTATAMIEITNSWNDFSALMDQVRILAPPYFDDEIDTELANEQLLEQIGRKLNTLITPEPSSNGSSDEEDEGKGEGEDSKTVEPD